MFYTMYLDGLCKRRHWPQPAFQPSLTRQGYTCVVRVNNREYSTDVAYTTEALARDAAATRAYMICRNFSVNDGMFPGQKPGDGTVQGIPVAIGSGRKVGNGKGRQRRLGDVREEDEEYEDEEWGSGGSSPRSVDSAVAGCMVGVVSGGGGGGKGTQRSQQQQRVEVVACACACRRAQVCQPYHRCQYCLRDAGYLPQHTGYGEWIWSQKRA